MPWRVVEKTAASARYGAFRSAGGAWVCLMNGGVIEYQVKALFGIVILNSHTRPSNVWAMFERLFCWLLGWGESAFPGPDHYWWVPIAGPLVGGVVGAGLYQFLVKPYLPRRR